MRKPRADAKLLNLPEEQQAQLADWLLDGMPYHQAAALVEKDFRVSVGISAFPGFWAAVCVPQLLLRRNRAHSTAEAVADEAAKQPGRFDQATIDALKQKAFEQAMSPGADPKAVKAIFSLVLKARDQDLDEKQLTLDREKFQFDAAKACLAQLPALKQIAANPQL